MKKEFKANNVFEKHVGTREQTVADARSGQLGGLAQRPGHASKFKLDLLNQTPENEPISYFKNGDFIDLCAGPRGCAPATSARSDSPRRVPATRRTIGDTKIFLANLQR